MRAFDILCGKVAALFAISALALFLTPSPASAQLVTNVFHGTVAATAADGFSPATTNDFADPFGIYPSGPFGGGNLIGRGFTLTTTMDVSDPNSDTWDGVGIGDANFFTGSTGYQGGYPYGGLYNCCSPMTATLTIKGHSVVFDDQTGVLPTFSNISSDGVIDPYDLQEQAFYWLNNVQYFGIDLILSSPNPVFGSDFTTPLATLLASNDFTVTYAAFYTIGGEVQNLDILNVNGPYVAGVPEPATWAMLLLGFGGLGVVLRLRRRLGAAAA
jgi:hypothetical protein